MKKLQLPFFAFALSALTSYAQKPVFNSVNANANSIAKYNKFELTIDLTAAYTNPYDYNDISTKCIFTAPNGRKDSVDGFYMENYSLNITTGALTDLGTHNFRVRYAPNIKGAWSYVLSATNSAGTTTQPPANFQCTAPTSRGFIKKNNTNYLNFDDGTQYIPVGEDMGWQDNNVVTDYTNWLGKLSSNGGNFIRVWMSDWAFALEWKNGYNGYSGLEKYKQTSAYYLDWLLDECNSLNVYMMLCLNHHGQVSTTVNPEWSNNPYNAANGGPCTNTWDFFTNTTAKNYYKNRQRYIIARYGYSKNIQSWELFNEVDWTDDFTNKQSSVTSWHNEMANYIKSKDVYKHLVTTSYAYDTNDPDTWQLPNIDFTQTHYYVSAPNLETILANGAQNYLSSYHKPTLNGEFGLSGDGSNLATLDPNGVYIHNAIWGSTLGGAMGSAMSWWWDNYIDPRNLYYHYKPLSTFLAGVQLKNNNYKKVSSKITGGGKSDLIISPGESFVKATANDFTIDANGNITPDANNLSQYLFGNTWNTQYRNPPTFHVNYTVAGKFEVITGNSTGTAPTIVIYIDGVQKLNSNAAINTTYSIDITKGSHSIKVDNLGTDWISISNYTFTNIAPPLENFVLRSADKNSAAGWLLNKKYNWQYLHDNGTTPPPVNGASVHISNMNNGNYTVNFYSCSTGNITSTINATATNNNLVISLPSITWDVAFTVLNQSVLALDNTRLYGEQQNNKNILHIEMSQNENAQSVLLERSSDGIHFIVLSNLNSDLKSLNGQHIYTDELPLNGNNYYRLHIVNNDGNESISATVLVIDNKSDISVSPNPFKDYIMLNADAGKYFVVITDSEGKNIFNSIFNTNGNDTKISLTTLTRGMYYIVVKNESGGVIKKDKIVKQ